MTKILSRLASALLPHIKADAKAKLLAMLDADFARNVSYRANAKIDFPFANEAMEKAIIKQVVDLVISEAEGLIRKL